MDERRVADYFVVAGLPECPEEMGEFSQEGTLLKPTHCLPPITDVTVIFQSLGETIPPGFTCISTTPTGHSANLTAGGWRSSDAYLCYRRGLDKPPLVDVGVIYEGKERIMADSKIVHSTPEGRPASVSSGSSNKTFVTYRRAPERMPCNQLVVTDICVILPSKGESPPYAFRLIDKSLNKSLMGMSGVYICYKKSMHRPTLITYKPGVLARYPRTDRSYFPFPETVPLFCLPMGATVESWPAEAAQPKPVFSTFVLTVSDASEKVYGSAVTFYERLPDDNLTPEQRNALRLNESTLRSVNANKCICILSHWPFFDTFERFLKFLYEMTCDGPHTVPVERYISYFLEDVPFPSPKRPRILVQLSATDRVVLTQPEDLPLPRSGAGFCQLLTNLGPENCMMVMLLALTEQKLLVHSLRPDVLTAVAEAISMIIFPFKWQCPYIPLCPLGLADILHAPLPFLIGVDSRFFDLYDPPPDVSCVDLDTNSITICEERRALSTKLLPKRAARALRATLQRLFIKLRVQPHQSTSMHGEQPDDESIDRDFFLKRKEQELELEIQEAFLHFMASILKGYRAYLLPITKAPTAGTTDPSSLFDLQGFVRSRDKAHHKFFGLIMKTQMFIRFIEERSFVSDMDASLAFFDDCADKMDATDESDTPLLELDDSQNSERTVFIMPPEPTGLPAGSTYSYRGFVLNPLLFSQKEMKHFLGHGKETLSSVIPGSPVAKRTKHEIRCAQKLARKFSATPILWAKCLLGTCYSLWFIHLPSHAIQSQYKAQCLQKAYNLLVKIHKLKVQPTDEVCYRVVMQLCGLYSLPVLAVKLLFLMKRSGLQPNAITYGFYNRAVLEAAWPSDMTNSSQLLWNKLRNVIVGVALFRRAGRKSARRRLSLSTDNVDRVSLGGVSMESVNSSSHDSAMLRASKEVLEVLPEQDKSSNTAIAAGNSSDAGYGSLYDPQSTSRVCLHEHEVGPGLPRSTSSTSDALKPEISVESESTLLPEPAAESVTCDQIRPRVSSIVKGGATTPLTPTLQHPFESSAGLLMSGSFDGPSVSNHTLPERRPVSVGATDTSSRRRHGSSGSSDLARLRHEQRVQGSACTDTDCFKMLRSESFANDAKIFEKLSKLKVAMQEEEEEEERTKLTQPIGNGPCKGKLSKEAARSESQDLEDAVMDYMSQSDTPPKASSQHAKHSATAKPLPGIGRSPHSPARMPVTENDPLGALNGPDGDGDETPKQLPSSLEQSPARTWVHSEEAAGMPVLFKDSSRHRRAKTEEEARKFHPPVMRSATYHQGLGTEAPVSDSSHDCDTDDCYPDDDGKDKKVIQRSSTLPVSPSTSALSKGVAASPSVASSLSSLSSSFKLPFRRYSPGRLSLRKPDLRLGTQMLENAQNALTHFSPGSLAGKRSNELLMNLKSAASTAATSMVKKFDEIKEVISANATPVKGTGLLASGGGGTRESSIMDDEEYGSDERRRTSTAAAEFSPLGSMQQYTVDYWGSNLLELFSSSDGGGSRKGSATNLHPNDVGSDSSLHNLLREKMYQRKEDVSIAPIALEVIMTTCSKCHNCSSIVYDEEIMAGWVPDDSNLNTKCHFCEKWMVPFLTVSILDYREQPVRQLSNSPVATIGSTHSLQELRPSDTLHPDQYSRLSSCPPIGARLRSKSESQLGEHLNIPRDEVQDKNSEESYEPVALEPISVPYLNPLVLRKEVENILDTEGDVALNRSHFVDDHPIIYWNLVWVFQRIDVESHLPYLSLEANTVNRNRDLHPSWNDLELPGVLVRCMWDNARFFSEVGTPMYVLWQQDQQTRISSMAAGDVSRSTMQQVISGVKCNDLLEPLRKCVEERKKLKSRGVLRRYSVYRDILFLALGALGRENIDQVAFDEEYRIAFERLSVKDLKMYQKYDQPLSNFAICCRHFFRELEL